MGPRLPRIIEKLGLHGFRTQHYVYSTIYTLYQYERTVYITLYPNITVNRITTVKDKGLPQQADVAQGVPGRLRPRIFLTFGTTRVVGRQPYAPAAFTPGEIPGNHFQGLSRPQNTWFLRGEPRKKFPVTPPGIDLCTVRLVVQCLNHYATPGPIYVYIYI
jgi:hypothetical protein